MVLDSERMTDGARWRIALAVVGGATVLRVLLLFITRVELYPDEAQYWLWSRRLAFGYFSKPPMIAWLIGLTTAIGGNGEAWVRLSAPFLHAGAALALYRAAQRLYDARTALWSAAIYTLIAGVQLSSLIISTDAPLMLTISLALWAYAALWTAGSAREKRIAAACFGLAVGAGVLTKYAALYIPAGVALHAVLSMRARRCWDPVSVLIAVAATLAVASPNLIWNASHHFQTLAHTADNADLGDERAGLKGLFGTRGPFGFILGQFGAFGPLPFAIVLLAAWRSARRKGSEPDLLLVCIALPAFVVVLGESILARANANWAGAGYPACAVLVAAMLARWRSRTWSSATLATQSLIAVAFFIGMAIPGAPDAIGAGAAFKRARGWRETTAGVLEAARKANGDGALSAIAVDDRFLFNALSYYGRDDLGRPAGALPAPLKAWIHLKSAANQAEAEAPLLLEQGRRVLGVSASADYAPAFRADFIKVVPVTPPQVRVRLDRKHERVLDLFVGSDYRRRPRDPFTGRPIAP